MSTEETEYPPLDKAGLLDRLRAQVRLRDGVGLDGVEWSDAQHRINRAHVAIRTLVAACLLLGVDSLELTKIVTDPAVVPYARDYDLKDENGRVYSVAHALYEHAQATG